MAQGVYRLAGSPTPGHLELRAAWLQLASDVPAWRRTPGQGVVSHRSAAAVYGLGHLPADRHEFTLPVRRQSRRPDMRLHLRELSDSEWTSVRGLPVTRPAQIAADLLADREGPEAVGHFIADAIRGGHDSPATFADALAPHAAKFALQRLDGIGVLGWLLDLVGDPSAVAWMADARRILSGVAPRNI